MIITKFKIKIYRIKYDRNIHSMNNENKTFEFFVEDDNDLDNMINIIANTKWFGRSLFEKDDTYRYNIEVYNTTTNLDINDKVYDMLIDKFNNRNISIDVFYLKPAKFNAPLPMMNHRAYLPDEK